MKYKCTFNHRATNTRTVFYTNNLRGAFARVMGSITSTSNTKLNRNHALIVGCWNGNGIIIEY